MPPSGLLLPEVYFASYLEKTKPIAARGEQTGSASPGWVASHPFASPRHPYNKTNDGFRVGGMERSESRQDTIHWDLGMVHRPQLDERGGNRAGKG